MSFLSYHDWFVHKYKILSFDTGTYLRFQAGLIPYKDLQPGEKYMAAMMLQDQLGETIYVDEETEKTYWFQEEK